MKYRGINIPFPRPPQNFPSNVLGKEGLFNDDHRQAFTKGIEQILSDGCLYLPSAEAQWQHTEDVWMAVWYLLSELRFSNASRRRLLVGARRKKAKHASVMQEYRYLKGTVGKGLTRLASTDARATGWTPQSEEEQQQLVNIINRLTDPDAGTIREGDLAELVGVSLNKLRTIKVSSVFKKAMLEAIESNAMIQTAMSMPAQATIAQSPGNKQAASAFKNIAQVAGALKTKSEVHQTGQVEVKHGIEGLLERIRAPKQDIIDVGGQ